MYNVLIHELNIIWKIHSNQLLRTTIEKCNSPSSNSNGNIQSSISPNYNEQVLAVPHGTALPELRRLTRTKQSILLDTVTTSI